MMTSAIVFAIFVLAAALLNVVVWRRDQLQRQAAILVRIERSPR